MSTFILLTVADGLEL